MLSTSKTSESSLAPHFSYLTFIQWVKPTDPDAEIYPESTINTWSQGGSPALTAAQSGIPPEFRAVHPSTVSRWRALLNTLFIIAAQSPRLKTLHAFPDVYFFIAQGTM